MEQFLYGAMLKSSFRGQWKTVLFVSNVKQLLSGDNAKQFL